METNEIVLEIFPQDGARYLVRLRYSQAGSAGEAAPVSGTAIFDEGALRDLRRTALDPLAHGRLLRKIWLEAPGLLPAWQEFLARMSGGMRFRLQIDPRLAWLHALRWETLRDGDDQDFLALNPNLAFSRCLYAAENDAIELRPRRELRALLLAANPQELQRPGGYTLLTAAPGQPADIASQPAGILDDIGAGVTLVPVDVAGELGRARAILGELDVDLLAGPLPDGSLLPGTLGRPTLERLADRLRQGYDVVYIVAHGMLAPTAFILLEKEDGGAQRVSADALVACIRNLPAERRPRLAALASCQSGGRGRVPAPARYPGESDEDERSYDRGALAALGPLLVDAGVPAVIAMQANVKMETSQRFMQVFFDELLKTGRVDQAAATARSQARQRPDWWAPVIYLRLRSGLLFSTPDGRPLGRLPFEPQTIYIPAGNEEAAEVLAAKFGVSSAFGVNRVGVDSPQASVALTEAHYPLAAAGAHLPAFRIGKYPITNREYQQFLRAIKRIPPAELGWSGQNPPPGEDDFPVRGVTWFEAVDYCRWLTEQTGRAYGLPNEAQWERAACGGHPQRYPWGAAWEPTRCNAGNPKAAAVSAFPPQSDFGASDLVGNVLQWTTTLWGEQRLAPNPQYALPWQADGRDDLNANRQIRRVARGSSYRDAPAECESGARRSFLPGDRGVPGRRLGFRVVISLESEGEG